MRDPIIINKKNMKKIIFTIAIILLFASTAGYAQFFKDPETENEKSIITDNLIKDNEYGGFFRAPAESPGTTRPDRDGGIGVTAPLGDGLNILIVCSAFFGLVTFYKNKRKNK